MNLEIHKPELARRVQAQIQSGHFQSADDLIEKALDALDERTDAAAPTQATGAVVLAALQASPYQDVDLTWLRKSWDGAKESGTDQLSMDEVDREIAAVRKARVDQAALLVHAGLLEIASFHDDH